MSDQFCQIMNKMVNVFLRNQQNKNEFSQRKDVSDLLYLHKHLLMKVQQETYSSLIFIFSSDHLQVINKHREIKQIFTWNKLIRRCSCLHFPLGTFQLEQIEQRHFQRNVCSIISFLLPFRRKKFQYDVIIKATTKKTSALDVILQ